MYPQPSLLDKFSKLVRSLVSPYTYRGEYWITRDCRTLVRYDRRKPWRKFRDKPIRIAPGTPEWLTWCNTHDRLIISHPKLGRALVRRETYRRKLAGGIREYDYWRAYMWPMRRRKPVRVYFGILDRLGPDDLLARLARLSGRYEHSRAYHLAEKERRKRRVRHSARRRWYLRSKARQSATLRERERFAERFRDR